MMMMMMMKMMKEEEEEEEKGGIDASNSEGEKGRMAGEEEKIRQMA